VDTDDEVFKALADPTRRTLLDELFRSDGQTLTALESRLPMTRFGVMKHLRVLEEAGLVTTRKQGREKHHFLNPVPIRIVHDRWVSKFAEPWAATLTGIKREIEKEEMTMEEFEVEHKVPLSPSPDGEGAMAVFEIYIRTTPERLWEAITDAAIRARYSFGAETISDWTPGSGYKASVPGAIDIGEGENLEVDPPRRLVQTFTALWSEDVRNAGPSRVTWEITPVGDSCQLTVIHDRLAEDANPELYGGWPMILSGLKTLLETGEELTTPGSLMYTGPEA
jgi:uncharacterized protein YndB with AHSA1/START domain/DNA-binding transcriptional ArsR family regulator